MSDWDVLGESTVFDNGIVRVRLERVRTPGGDEADWTVVEVEDGAAVLPIEDDGSVHMIRQYRPTVRRSVLEFPAGRLESGEDPASAARRELREEAGLEAARLEPLGTILPLDGIARHRIHLFVARGLTPCAVARETFEDIRVETIPAAELSARIADGRIEDGVALALVARAAAVGARS